MISTTPSDAAPDVQSTPNSGPESATELASIAPFAVGSIVRVIAVPPYLKTAEPMPMLRSSAFLNLGDQGTILGPRPGGQWAVRFGQTAYLMSAAVLALVEPND